MIVRQRFDGRDHPFEGERRLVLGKIPAGARVVHARAVVSPVLAEDGGPPVETLAFAGEAWGATRVRQQDFAGGPPGWVEIDFHTRRTLHSVRGSALGGATVEIDLGGAFAEVKRNGTLLAPGDPDSDALRLSSDDALLPGLTVARFRLTRDGASPDLTHVRVRGVPRNVSLALGAEPAFFTHPGELTRAVTIDDFTAVLAAFLEGREPRDGFHRVPLALRSDALGRVDVEVEVDLLIEQSVLPPGLDEVTVPYAYGALPETGRGVLEVSVPPGMRVRAVEGRVVGGFEDSRVVLGPVGELPAEPPSVPLSSDRAQAQRLVLTERLEASAVDLLLAAVSRRARLEVDLLVDLDGRPGGGSLLPRPAAFTLERETAGGPTWVSVPLGTAVQLEAHDPERSWLAVKVLEGEALWFASAEGLAGAGELRSTDDGGLSWRRSEAAGAAAPAALFRLRHRPEVFRMPVELQVGTGDAARRISFAAQEARGRLELDLGAPEVAAAFDEALAAGAAAGAEGEALDNPGFERWSAVGDALGTSSAVELGDDPSDGSLLAASPDGRRAYVVTAGFDSPSTFRVVDLVCRRVVGPIELDTVPPVAVVAHPAGRKVYVALPRTLYVIDVEDLRVVGSAELRFRVVTALALSPDGEDLFVASAVSGGEVGNAGSRVDRISTGRLEAASLAGGAEDAGLLTGPEVRTADLEHPARALGVSPDGARLVVLSGFDSSTAAPVRRLQALDAATLTPLASAVETDPRTIGLALGAGRLVTTEASALVARDPVDLRALGRVPVAQASGAVALSPDGRRAFVAGRGRVAGVDLERRRSAGGLDLGSRFVSDLAVTPDGGHLLAALREAEDPGSLAVVPIGSHLPDEWAVTGPALRLCPVELGESVLVLGAPAAGRQDAEKRGPDGPFGLSQVAPVVGGTRYELAVEAIATVEDARVELSWIAEGCGRLDSATLALPSLVSSARSLETVRLTATAPPDARQAEVRLRLPDGIAAVRSISLTATADALDNGRFQGDAGGVPAGWEVAPAGSTGLTVSTTANGRVRVASAVAPVTLVQAVEVEAGQLFELSVEAASVSAAELRVTWTDAEGRAAGPPSVLPLAGAGPGEPLRVRGTVPAGAAEARLVLALPAGGSLTVERLSFALRKPQRVPAVFVAEAPGELRIRDWRVAYEPAEPVPAPRPGGGLCAPTPPDLEAGESCGDETRCPRCGKSHSGEADEEGTTPAGRAVAVTSCPGCGAEDVRFESGLRPVSAPLGVRTLPPVRRAPSSAAAARGRPIVSARRLETSSAFERSAPAPVLTDLVGIADKRAAQLEALGIDTVARLAAADPGHLARGLTGVSPPLAENLIAQARRLVR